MERCRNTNLARELRHSMTEAETRLWYQVRDRRLLGYKFRRQVPIGKYVADFACLEVRLIIELDGSQHLDATEKDSGRTNDLVALGFRVLRFWNDDVFLRLNDVLEQIVASLRNPAAVE